jgi:chemotaxis protein CheX
MILRKREYGFMAKPDMPPDAREVDLRIQEELLAPLSEATTVTFREVVKSEIICLTLWKTSTPEWKEGRTVAVEQQYPHGNGRMYLNVQTTALREIARRMLPDKTHVIDDALADDCLGEILNVIAGQGKALLGQSRWHYTFSTPKLITDAVPADTPGSWLVVMFQSEFGPIYLTVKVGEIN